MAITVPNQWTLPVNEQDAEIITNPTSGNWLVAVITCRVTDGSAPLLNIGDPSRNLWTLMASPTTIASAAHTSAQLQAEVWGCPAVRFDGWSSEAVYASAMAIVDTDVGAVNVNVFEVAGMANGTLTVDSVTLNTATASTSLVLTAPAPTGGVNCLMVAVAAANTSTTPTPSGTGWTGLTGVTGTSPNLGQGAAWREATTGGSVTFTLGTSQSWAGVVVAFRTTGVTPAQPNPNWPGMQLQIGLGYDLSTPMSRVQWTDQTSRFKELLGDRGIQAELGVASQGQGSVVLDNRDGAYTPRDAGSATANAAGSTTTIKIPDAQATNIFKGDFFQLKTSTGALKEFTVFQVSATPTSLAGTTTVTFKRADGGTAALAATASGDQYAGIPIDLYIPYRLLATWSGKTYVVASGWLLDVTVTYDGAAYSEAQIATTDALETLTAANVSALSGEILRRKPTHYWPMGDAAGGGYAANASGFSNASLTQTASKFGVASATADFGAGTQDADMGLGTRFTVLGDAGSGWQVSGMVAADIGAGRGYALVGQGINDFPPITGGVTVFGVFATDYTTATTVIEAASVNPTLFILRNTDPGAGVAQGSVIKLAIDRTQGYGSVVVWDKATHGTSGATATANSLLANFRTWALVFDTTSWTFYADGVNELSGSANLVSTFNGIDVGGEADQFNHGRCMPGLHCHVAVFGRKLSANEIGSLDFAMRSGTPRQERISTRIRRKLNTVGWRGPRVVNVSDSNAATSAEASPSGSVADIVNEVAGYYDGLVFADAAGQLQYRDRVVSFQQSARATLGEDTAGGEIPYQPGMSASFQRTYVYNNIEIANTSAILAASPQTTTIVAVDDASDLKRGTRTLQRSTRFTDTYPAWDVTWWYLNRYTKPKRRVESVTIEARAASARWPFVLGAEVGDLVSLTKRHLGAPAYTIRCQVLRVTPHIIYGQGGQVSGSVTLTLAGAPSPVPIANDPALGIVGGTVLGA